MAAGEQRYQRDLAVTANVDVPPQRGCTCIGQRAMGERLQLSWCWAGDNQLLRSQDTAFCIDARLAGSRTMPLIAKKRALNNASRGNANGRKIG